MRFSRRTITIFIIIFIFVLTGISFAVSPVNPTDNDKCPVCGMQVTPYPKWIAQIIFKDGTYAVFDGSKDMMKYYLNIQKYNKSKTGDDIAEVYVTEYYSTKLMKAEDVYFIAGSDVMGPMGKELIPIKGKKEAQTFMKDHNGMKMLGFDEITESDIPGMMKMKGM